jgi:hypothetical protein
MGFGAPPNISIFPVALLIEANPPVRGAKFGCSGYVTRSYTAGSIVAAGCDKVKANE